VQALGLWLLILAGAYGAGAGLLTLIRVPLAAGLKKCIFAVSLGLGVMAYAVLTVGLLGGLKPAIGWLLLSVFLLTALGYLGWSWRRKNSTSTFPARREGQGRVAAPETESSRFGVPSAGGEVPWGPRMTGMLLLLGLGLEFLWALAPPTAWDDLTYHLAAPKVYVQAGRIHYIPYDHHTNFPFTLEMLYTLALLLGSDITAKLVHFAYFLLTLGGLLVFGNAFLGWPVGLLAAATFAFVPTVMWETGTAYNEFGVALYQLLTVWAFVEYLSRRRREPGAGNSRWLLLAGVYCGLALGVKATAGLTLFVLLGWLFVRGWKRRDPPFLPLTGGGKREGLVREAVKVTLLAAVVASPWYVKSYLWTGNPVFPFAHGLFRSPLWSQERARVYREAQLDFGRPQAVHDRNDPTDPQWYAHRRWYKLFTVLWRATMNAPDFYDRAQFFAFGHLGPLFLAFLPIALGMWWSHRSATPAQAPGHRAAADTAICRSPSVLLPNLLHRQRGVEGDNSSLSSEQEATSVMGFLLTYAAVALGFWFATMQYTRYLIPTLPIWALAVAYGADRAARLTRYAQATIWTLLMLTFLLHLGVGALFALEAVPPVLGGEPRDLYLQRVFPSYAAQRFINEFLPSSAKIILYGEPRGYYLEREYLWGEPYHSTLIPYEQFLSAEEMLRYFGEELGATHILVNEMFFPWRTASDRWVGYLREALDAGQLVPLFAEQGLWVWEIRFPAPEPSAFPGLE